MMVLFVVVFCTLNSTSRAVLESVFRPSMFTARHSISPTIVVHLASSSLQSIVGALPSFMIRRTSHYDLRIIHFLPP